MTDDLDFAGRTLLLTGANGGIGRATAGYFLARGANVAMGDRDAGALEDFAHSLSAQTDRVLTFAYEAAEWEAAGSAVESCLTRFGAIDFLVPAAAIYQEQPFLEMTEAQWRRTLSVNLDGVFYLCRHAVPAMREGSAIVTVSSDAAHQGSTSGHAHYGASKGGVLALTRSLARELAPKIRVNAVSPGVIDTPMVAEVMRRHGERILGATPAGRLGAPREVAAVIAFLCSDAASYLTGETVQVNGGAYIA